MSHSIKKDAVCVQSEYTFMCVYERRHSSWVFNGVARKFEISNLCSRMGKKIIYFYGLIKKHNAGILYRNWYQTI